MTDALVIGAGPAGLMAAEILADAGHSVLIVEAKPSVGRKLLMAGKSGLNLTKDEPDTDFQKAFGPALKWLKPSLNDFGPKAVQDWAATLGQSTFVGSTRRVFPIEMKASPLLRAWLKRLSDKNVTIQTRWHWVDWDGAEHYFDTTAGRVSLTPKCTVLAVGGASWSRLGSDGAWASILARHAIKLNSFKPTNMGIVVPWSHHMAPHFGLPLKNIRFASGDKSNLGECVLSETGLEGSLVYQFSPELRVQKPLTVDLCPDLSLKDVTQRIAKHSSKTSRSNMLRKALRFDPAKIALVQEFARQTPVDELARTLKSLRLPYIDTAPLDAAISVAGGVSAQALTPDLMLKDFPGVFCAGEMLDWEAPTGGYLITGCLATGRTAGRAAASYLSALN